VLAVKLVIQIPCLNEEKTLPATLADLPQSIPGVDQIEVLIVDDGSTDRTVEVARQCGVQHVVRFSRNQGLAAAFRTGLDESLRLGADIIVHTDADNQYQGRCIPDLIRPILEGRADLVVGCRPIERIGDFSWLKKRLQRLGSWVVRQISGTSVPDATSGFRAYSRQAAYRLNVVSRYTYTLETLIQAGQQNIPVTFVDIQTNPKTRESRLFRSMASYIQRSLITMLRIYAMYRPLRTFGMLGTGIFGIGVLLGLRWLYLDFMHIGGSHAPLAQLCVALLILGFLCILMGLIGDLTQANRRLMEEILYRQRKQEVESVRTISWNSPADAANPGGDRTVR
jgi:glycosyltransferase involved in cell wall biosynthesis